jgi:hypothetical protein
MHPADHASHNFSRGLLPVVVVVLVVVVEAVAP